MRKVFVTGGTGFIGSHLVEHLIKRKIFVRCLVRPSHKLRWLKGVEAELVHGDLNDTDTLESAVKGVDTVFHLAGKTTSPTEEGFYQANAVGTMNLLKAIIQSNSRLNRFVYLSSLSAVGPSSKERFLTESDSPNPLIPYGSSKLAGEEAVSAFKTQIPVTIIRPPAVYGPRDLNILKLSRIIQKGIKPVLGWRMRYMSFIYIDDLIKGILMASESRKGEGQTYFLVADNHVTYQDLNRVVSKALGKRALTVHIPIKFFTVAIILREMINKMQGKPVYLNRWKIQELRQRYWICDDTKSRDELKFHTEISLEEGIEKTIAWYREMGWL